MNQQGLAAGSYPVVQQVARGWAGRATGCDILYPAGVIPGTPLRAVRVKHVDELRSAGGEQLFEPGMADPGALQAASNRPRRSASSTSWKPGSRFGSAPMSPPP